MDSLKLLLKPVEVAEAIGVGRSKVYELIGSGALPSVRIGSSVRVPLDLLRKWVAKQADDKDKAEPAGEGATGKRGAAVRRGGPSQAA